MKDFLANLMLRSLRAHRWLSLELRSNSPIMSPYVALLAPIGANRELVKTIVIRYFPKVDLLISAANEDSQVEVGPLARMLAITK